MSRVPPRSRPPAAAREPGRLRVFLALWPDADTCRALAAWRDAQPWPGGVRRTPDDKLHLTLHFMGSQPAARVAALAAALLPPPQPFSLVLTTAQIWRGGLVALCPREIPAALALWHGQLAERLHALALPVEARAFRPHVTVARDAGPRPVLAEPAPLEWPVHRLVLVESTTDGRYRILREGPVA